jgi:signal transduction histidine kinase
LSSGEGLEWLAGGGEMGALIRSMDWSKTPLGPFERWSQSLRTTVSLCLSSTFPILIAWGPERVQIYNDSYRPITGQLHPASMGQRFNECWASALPAVGHVVDRAQQGEGSYIENLRMFLDRHGYVEEAFMTFSFSPIRDESGQVGGLFHPITEVTDKMLSSRRTQILRDLAARVANAKTLAEAWQLTVEPQPDRELDLPFLLFYRFDDSLTEATLVGACGITPGAEAAAPTRASLAPGAPWSLEQAVGAREVLLLESLPQLEALAGVGPYPEPPRAAFLIPVQPAGANSPIGCLVAGVSARRGLDSAYRAFFESLGAIFTTALANVRAYEHELRRANELAELDRAKTAFFSNVSHEFRTPLTLMLGPTEDALDTPERALTGEALQTVHRNELRLLKLVNSLLDFSRIEAGRAQAAFEPTDLSRLTAGLTSAFRSTVERAGLQLVVDCPPLGEPIFVDHEMWEKVVLNLVSNAFKFTFEGSITVSLREEANRVDLIVQDTGGGIPESELPRLFERFHRVEGARGRSYEGSGIGLALVRARAVARGGAVRNQ